MPGVVGAVGGSAAAKAIDGQRMLVLFGVLMIAVGLGMLRSRSTAGNPEVRLSMATARELLLPLLVGIGFAVGLLSGFFGVGGGFLIVPGLMFGTGMPLTMAIGTSLVAVAAFGAATAASYAFSGMVDWPTAGHFVVGGLIGSLAGVALGKALAGKGRTLNLAFAGVVVSAGLYVVAPGTLKFMAA